MQDQQEFKSGFVALLGRPNCGKSTLLNTILSHSLSIVTALPQTTRKTIRGIYNEARCQIVFVDTPGIHRGRHLLNKSMLRQATQLMADRGIDVLCYIVDLSRSFGEEEDLIAAGIASSRKKTCVVFNKIDLQPNSAEVIDVFFKRYPGLKEYPWTSLCAKDPAARIAFLDMVKPMIPPGPPLYPPEDLSDASLRFLTAERIRKQIITLTNQEVPHAAFVEIDAYKEFPGHHSVQATIHVETDGQKGIIIGKRGSVIKKIEKAAQQELLEITGTKVIVKCHVKVSPHWRDDEGFLRFQGVEIPEKKKS